MAPKTPSKTTQVTEVKLPAWVDKASQENYAMAQQIADKPYNPYTGQTVADVGQGTTDAWKMFYDTMGTGNKEVGQASDIFNRVGNSTAPTVTPKSLADADLTKYMNPFTDEVENRALGALDRSRIQALMGNADKAVAAKAFGGNRAAVVDAITNSQSAIGAGDLSAKLRSDNFSQAQAAATGDISRDLTGQQTNASNWLANMQQQLAGGQGLLSAGGALSDQRGKDVAGLSAIGAQQQQQQQKVLDDAKGKFDEANNYDTEKLNLLLASLGMSPYGKSESTTKTTQGGSGGTDFAQMGLGILSLLPMIPGLSDRDEKTDIKKVGFDEGLGLDLFAYRYKGDPKTYPKVVGPMAQDVEKKYPGAVKKVNGKRVVDMRFLTGGVNAGN